MPEHRVLEEPDGHLLGSNEPIADVDFDDGCPHGVRVLLLGPQDLADAEVFEISMCAQQRALRAFA